MLPKAATNQFTDRLEPSNKIKPWRTWRMELDGDRIRGTPTELEALNQTIYTLLRIERFQWPIYSDVVGLQMSDLRGKPKRYVYAILTQRIPETLLIDDRIKKVYNFKMVPEDSKGHTLAIEYTVDSKLGTFTRREDLDV